MNKLLVIAVCLALSASATFASPSAGAKTPFVTAKAPAQATVEEFVKGTLAVTVTCREACKATVFATIKAGVAKRLGFTNVKGRFVLVATGKKTLKGRTPTKIALVPTPAAKKRLKGPVDIVGSAKGVPAKPGSVTNYFVGWSTRLS